MTNVRIYDNVFLFYLIRKERFLAGKTKLVYGKLHLDVTHFVKVLCYLQFLKNTKSVGIVLNHF